MAKQNINVGTTANDKKGDSLRAAFVKVNANFTELYTALGINADVNLNIGAFEFVGSTLTTTDSSAIVIDQAATITSNLTVGGDIVPSITNGGDLGSAAKPWRSLYVSNNTIFLGGTAVGVDANGNLTTNGTIVGGGGNEFNQSLNTGDSVTFNSVGATTVNVSQINGTNPGDELVIQANNNNWNFGTDGILTFPDSDLTIGNQLGGPTIASAPGTPLQIVSSGAESSAAMAWVDDIEAATKIAGVVANNLLYVGDGDVGIVTGDSLNVEGGTVNIWNFDADGTLTVPGNITKTSGNLEITAENYVIIDSTNSGQIDIGANQSGEGSGDSGPILVGHAGNILDIAAGKLRINSTTPPTTSTGAVGDVAGLVAFSSGYLYYCTADYGQVGHQVTIATAYNGATSLNTNAFQLTKTADTLQITVGDVISDSDGGATSTVVTVSSDENYTYVGTGGLAYNAVFPLTFTSTDPAYVSGGNIWKRVAWSGDTW